MKDNHEGHEGHEGHEQGLAQTNREDQPDRELRELPIPARRMRLPSPLSKEAEEVMSLTIGAAIAVHRALGPGFLESIYRRAMCIELDSRRLAYEVERPVTVKYRDREISGQRIDLVVQKSIVVELKSVSKLDEIHRAQLISYMRSVRLRGGLLINFRVAALKNGLRRVVL